MRTPNCKCVICHKPLYRRPFELRKVRYVACMEHRTEAQKRVEITDAQKAALAMGRVKGVNHLNGIPKSEESKHKRAASMVAWCASNPDKVKARALKTYGENHYNWKGGSSRLNKAVRLLTENRKWMDSVKERDGKCLDCGATENLEAHHKIELAVLIKKYGIKTREQARECLELWNLDNGKTLCQKCHYDEHERTYSEDLRRKIQATT